jgi:hypothetical protein
MEVKQQGALPVESVSVITEIARAFWGSGYDAGAKGELRQDGQINARK